MSKISELVVQEENHLTEDSIQPEQQKVPPTPAAIEQQPLQDIQNKTTNEEAPEQ